MASFLRSLTNLQYNPTRLFSRNAVNCEKVSTTVSPQDIAQSGKLSGKTHRVNNLEKRILVWAGKYKSVDEIPAWVTPESVEKARNRARIRLANYMMVATAFACLLMVISGKKAAERGESVAKSNLEWHRRINAEDAAKHEKQN